MPYTNPWSDNTPLGSNAADTMDDNMRQLRLDMAERMNTILGGDNWRTQDPIFLPGLLTAFKFARRYTYNDQLAEGSKASNPGDLKTLLIIRFVGRTNSGGNITINFGELFETYNLNSLDITSFVRGILINTDVNDTAFLLFGGVAGDIVTYSVRKANGSLYNTDDINGHILFWGNERPTT